VDDREAEVAVTAVREVLAGIYLTCREMGFLPFPTQVRAFGTWVVPAIRRGQPYWGTGWYVQNSLSPGSRRVIASRFLEMVEQEPWQRSDPHYDLALLHHDLVEEEGGDFVLGAALEGVGAVVSVLRLRFVLEEERRFLGLRRLVAHHFGHVLGVPAPMREDEVERSLGWRHCANTCAMRHAQTVEELVRLALEERAAGLEFCARCERELANALIISDICFN
jgi:predicted Zn-dependent protease